jgi:hypothetical protein
MKSTKKFIYKGKKSEKLPSITYNDYEIQVLKHGNTDQTLYSFPSKIHSWERCWTLDLQTAKNGINKYMQHLQKKDIKTE